MTWLDVSGYQEPSRNWDYYQVIDQIRASADYRLIDGSYFPKEKTLNSLEIPTKSIKGISYKNDTNLGDDAKMVIEMQPYGSYSFVTNEWLAKETVKKDYIKKDEAWKHDDVVQMLRDRALKLRVASANHGVKLRYDQAARLNIQATELELVANALGNTGKMPYGVL